jgi:hypothetical protein
MNVDSPKEEPMHRMTFRRSATLLFAAALIAVASVLVPATIASATSGPNAQLVSQNRVYGGGQFTTSPEAGSLRNFAIDAHANGATAYGDIEYASPFFWEHEQVTCLKVVGNSATVGAIITQADRPGAIHGLVLWVVQDNGNPLSSTPDAATFQENGPDPGLAGGWPNAGFPYVCPSPDTATSFFGLSYMPLNAGDFVVQNAASS